MTYPVQCVPKQATYLKTSASFANSNVVTPPYDSIPSYFGGTNSRRETIEHVFVSTNIEEGNECINFILVDFEKAFENLWLIMQYYGIPKKILRLVKLLYDELQCVV